MTYWNRSSDPDSFETIRRPTVRTFVDTPSFSLGASEPIERNLRELLKEDGLPLGMMKHPRHFLLRQDSTDELCALPLSPDEMIEVGRMIAHAPSYYSPTSCDPVPTLSRTLRYRMGLLIGREGEHAEAALFVLSHDLRARVFNRTLAANE